MSYNVRYSNLMFAKPKFTSLWFDARRNTAWDFNMHGLSKLANEAT